MLHMSLSWKDKITWEGKAGKQVQADLCATHPKVVESSMAAELSVGRGEDGFAVLF
jgi:hypothetical protein